MTTAAKKHREPFNWKKHFKRYGAYYLMLVIPMAILIIFKYYPMYGIQIAFKNYRITKPMEDCSWVGFKYFEKFFNYTRFWSILRNTLVINLYSLATFPLSLILALLLNHLPYRKFVKCVQNASYMPHFISTVVLCAMVIQFTNSQNGLINALLGLVGVPPVNYMAKKEYFYSLYVWSGVWQEVGYSSIIYIAALAGISPELHEAAIVDGASIVKRIWHIDIPGILPTFMLLLIMRCGSLLSLGYEKIILLQNSLNTEVSEVISSYSYNISLNSSSPQFSYSAAIGLFTSLVNVVVLVSVNALSKKLTQNSIW